MRNILISISAFVVSLLATTVFCTIAWEALVHFDVYDCTDPGFLDYLTPGDWVHYTGGHPVAVVQHVVHGRSMSEPDTIKQGSSIMGLWSLWFSFISASLLVSAFLEFLTRHQWKNNCKNELISSEQQTRR